MKDNIKIYAKTLDETTKEQIDNLSSSEAYGDCQIRIMPDAHAGSGCTIGTVILIKDKVVPTTVGVDIGCGMLVIKLGKIDLDLKKLDEIINESVPSGFMIHEKPVLPENIASKILDGIICPTVEKDKAWCGIGSLGGGNHFIEVDVDDEGNLYLVIHTGSRNAGKLICEYYQDIANKKTVDRNFQRRNEVIAKLKAEGRASEIQQFLKGLGPCKLSKDLSYLEGQDLKNYMHDMRLMEEYAVWNRSTIWSIIRTNMGLDDAEHFETIHNYIDTDSYIIRKGAVRADAGVELIIPMNMRDGSLICVGKGNADWLCSGPHGAGRLMSRSEARAKLSLDEFKSEMSGIYSTTVCQETIDESPMAYKPMDEIVSLIEPTVEIVKVIKPIYNFKAKEDQPIWAQEKEQK